MSYYPTEKQNSFSKINRPKFIQLARFLNFYIGLTTMLNVYIFSIYNNKNTSKNASIFANVPYFQLQIFSSGTL